MKIRFVLFCLSAYAIFSYEASALPNFGNIAKSIGAKLETAKQKATSVVSTAKAKVQSVGKVVNKAKDLATGAVNKVAQVRDKATSALSNARTKVEQAKSNAQQKVGEVINTVGGVASGAINIATGLVNEVGKIVGKGKTQDTLSPPQPSEEEALREVEEEASPSVVETMEAIEPEIYSVAKAEVDAKLSTLNQYLNMQGINLSNVNVVKYLAEKLLETYKEKGGKNLLIDLSETGLNAEGLQIFFDTLKTCPRLIKYLSLSNNKFGEAGAIGISEFLLLFPSIEYLVLDDNELGDNGFLTILNAIVTQDSINIRQLSVRRNALGDSCLIPAKYFVAKLNKKAFPEGIILSENNITNSSGLELPSTFVVK
ncbi:MAG: hypothetical protein LBU35_01610 [Holosporales bacterium]|jgi:hypothetical protein|nr:hypothetical protein [Holosporales bacterium]